ncbi:TIGR03086 family metal-binding protein [Pseudonocardia spirodelae]|uniref:TIGR03086 family metal-binding protein n=1 Tax=Pseudonocardia spirodelae TaxID=3133431 RepID=A0ABU8T120_9PSEU
MTVTPTAPEAPVLDLAPTARAVADVVTAVGEDQLGLPTPCADMTVAALLDHLHGLAWAFTHAARKSPEAAGTAPHADAAHLVADWRSAVPARLDELAEAWRDPAAWEGVTAAGGVEMPGEVGGVIALDELVLHGWDLAVATGRPFAPDDDAVAAVLEFTTAMSVPGEEASREGLFGPVVPVPADAPAFDRALGNSGRDPRRGR